MSQKTILLIGLSLSKLDLLDTFQSVNHRLLAYITQEDGTSFTDQTQDREIEAHHTLGAWLKDVDVIIPLISANDSADHATVMQTYQRITLALQAFQEPQQAPPLQPCWIDTVDPDASSPELREMYESLGGVHGKIHNLYKAFSLQPAPMIAADQHYRAILHNDANQSDPWFLELLSSQVAILTGCTYALANHGANFKKLLGDPALGEDMLGAVREGDLENSNLFNAKQSAFLKFGEKLTLCPDHMDQTDIDDLRITGATDTEILEAVQAIACFSYWTRFINGLGIQLGDETIGRLDL
ncbi:MAG: hypothetical protein HON65_14715 [Rhodospirillales bacterium]|nr:hypothetical protein [Rhodospirillales bacterium]